MEIHIPNSAFLGNIDSFLKSFNPEEPDKLEITANKKWISVHPVVLCMIASIGMDIKNSSIKCEKLEAKSKHYLERMKLFEFLGIKSGISITKHEAAGRFIPLTQIKESEELAEFIKEITPLLHLDPKHAAPIKYIMSELVRNVLEHSMSKNGAIVSAQYFQKTNTIRIGIADTGVGIWKTIRKSHIAPNDLEAIRLALVPGITGTTKKEGGTDFNAGAGLFFIKSMATVNRDFFMIYSGTAMYKLLKRVLNSKKITLFADPFDDKHSKTNNLPFWQGTLVGVDIALDKTQEFSLILKLINDTYDKAIKERKKKRYKEPKFI